MSGVPAEALGSMDNRRGSGALAEFATQVFAVADAEFRKLRHDPLELFSRTAQPVLWLVVFGKVMAQMRGLNIGSTNYIDFLAPGILAQSMLFGAIFYGIAAVWERDLGIIHRYLVSPASRLALVMGKQVSAGIRGLSQAALVYLVAIAMNVAIDWRVEKIAGVIVLIIIGAALFSTLSLIIACLVRTRERFMGIGQLLTMPIFFASNAIYPIDVMPPWLKAIATINPLTYEVDALRALMLRSTVMSFHLVTDFVVLVTTSVILLLVASRLYARMAT
jgi:ABC-2 type transport system permease protein